MLTTLFLVLAVGQTSAENVGTRVCGEICILSNVLSAPLPEKDFLLSKKFDEAIEAYVRCTAEIIANKQPLWNKGNSQIDAAFSESFNKCKYKRDIARESLISETRDDKITLSNEEVDRSIGLTAGIFIMYDSIYRAQELNKRAEAISYFISIVDHVKIKLAMEHVKKFRKY